jgi:Mycotoxin biosynthesis protein UstYa
LSATAFFWRINTKSLINLSQKAFISMMVSARPFGEYSMLTAMEVDNPHLEKLPVDFEQVAITVEPNDRFSLIDDEAWAATFPPKHGFSRLGPEGRAFAVGLYHQLHCVNALRYSYTVARDGLVTDPEILRNKVGHDNHCFQFLRQSIQCKADNSLVPISTTRNASLASMGFGITHRCRNWGQVKQFVYDNVAKWEAVPLFNGTSGRHVEN